MTGVLLLGGLLVAGFGAYNVGGSSTGPAFGPAVGAGVITKPVAAGAMSIFFFLGAWTIGRRVVDTLGRDLLRTPSLFTLEYSIVVLLFVGGGLLLGNLSGAPASTSMTAVGSIAGLGMAAGELQWAIVGEIVSWWIVSPVVGFWLAVMIGRYFYARVDRLIAIDRTEGPLVTLEWRGPVPVPARGPNTTRRELTGTAVLVGIGCLVAFSAGTSNIANAIAPLVGSGQVGTDSGILLGSAAVALGAFTVARRTMESLGNDITDLPLTAAIVGLGWRRATHTVTVADAVRERSYPQTSVGALTADRGAPTVGDPDLDEAAGGHEPIGTESADDIPASSELFDPSTTARVVAMQNVVPIVATVGSYLTFQFLIGL